MSRRYEGDIEMRMMEVTKRTLSLTLLSCCATVAMADDDVEKTLEADPNGTVTISNTAGMVDVRGWSRNEVHVIGDFGRGVEELEFERNGDDVTIKVKVERDHHRGGSADLEIQVPQNSSLKVSGVSADIDVRDVLGVQRLVSVSGDINSEAFGSDVEIETVSGDIELEGNDETAVTELSSVSGDVDTQNLAGEVTANSVSGELVLVDSQFSRARLHTTSGDIVFYAELLDGGRLNIETINGDLEVNFEESISAKFDIETFNGEIDNCFGPDPVRTSKYAPGTELRFSEGSGSGRVSIKTLNGDLRMCKD